MCDWTAAEHEYVTGKDAYRTLAKKYDVSTTVLSNYGREHGWVEKREKFRNKALTKAIQKSADAVADAYARAAASIAESAAVLAERMKKDIECRTSFKSYEYKHFSGALLDLAKLLPDSRIEDDTVTTRYVALLPERTEIDE